MTPPELEALADLTEEYPGWSIWTSDEGHWYATRRQAVPLAGGCVRTVHGADANQLRAELTDQANRDLKTLE